MLVILLMQNRCQIVYVEVELPGSNNRMHRYFAAYSICYLIKFHYDEYHIKSSPS
jgi:hypothetical protein